MTDGIRLDTHAIRECGGALRHVAAELQACGSISDGYADAVGHPKLIEAVREFAGNWDDTRNGILAAIAGLGEAGVAIADTFDGLDAELAKAMHQAMGGH